MISSCIDWLSMTFFKQNDAAGFILSIKDYGDSVPCKPQFGYDTAVKYQIGLIVMWSQGRDDMGTHIILSGSALEACAVAGNNTRLMLETAISLGAKVTRLDLAIDARDEEINIPSIYSNALVGNRTGSVHKFGLITGSDGGNTLYIGSRSSDKFARLYDKGIEAKVGGDWKRLEIEMKGDVAKEFSRVVAASGDKSIASFVWGVAVKMFDTPFGQYRQLGKDSDGVSMPKIEKVTNVEKWLSEQIIPIIEKFVKTHPDSTIYDELIQCLMRAKRKGIDKNNTGG